MTLTTHHSPLSPARKSAFAREKFNSLLGRTTTARAFSFQKLPAVARRALAVLLLLCVPVFVAAAEALAIDSLEAKYDSLHTEVMASIERGLKTTTQTQQQFLTHRYLTNTADVLGSIDRELDVLSTYVSLAQMVSVPHLRELARRHVDTQRALLIKKLANGQRFIEASLGKSEDSQANALLLRARDLLRESPPYVDRVQVPWQ